MTTLEDGTPPRCRGVKPYDWQGIVRHIMSKAKQKLTIAIAKWSLRENPVSVAPYDFFTFVLVNIIWRIYKVLRIGGECTVGIIKNRERTYLPKYTSQFDVFQSVLSREQGQIPHLQVNPDVACRTLQLRYGLSSHFSNLLSSSTKVIYENQALDFRIDPFRAGVVQRASHEVSYMGE